MTNVKLLNKQGLTEAAFKLGRFQEANNQLGRLVSCERVYLKWDKGVYHLHTNGRIIEGDKRTTRHDISSWSTFSSLVEARKAWSQEVKSIFAEDLAAHKDQTRNTVTLECNGGEHPVWVLRILDHYVRAYPTELQAQVVSGKISRVDLMNRYDSIMWVKENGM